jgi:hypothetical protein
LETRVEGVEGVDEEEVELEREKIGTEGKLGGGGDGDRGGE